VDHLFFELYIFLLDIVDRPRVILIKVVLITVGLFQVALCPTLGLSIRIEVVCSLFRLFNDDLLKVVVDLALVLRGVFTFAPAFPVFQRINVIVVPFVHLDVALQGRVRNHFLALRGVLGFVVCNFVFVEVWLRSLVLQCWLEFTAHHCVLLNEFHLWGFLGRFLGCGLRGLALAGC
jgi:hypothetical protein